MSPLPARERDAPAPAAPYRPPRMMKKQSSLLRWCRWPSSLHLRQRAPTPALSQHGGTPCRAAGPGPDARSAHGLCPLYPWAIPATAQAVLLCTGAACLQPGSSVTNH